MNSIKRTIALFCLFALCTVLAAVPVFADQVVVISGNYEEPEMVTVVQEDPYQGAPIRQETMPEAQIAQEAAAPAAAQANEAAVLSLSSNPTGLAAEIIQLTNERRAEYGLPALSYSAELQEAANVRAKESAKQFSHTRPDGSSCHSVLSQDYNVAGENLILVTSEYAKADLLVETWMNSETHRANILLSSFTQIAVGIYIEGDTTFVSQIFLG